MLEGYALVSTVLNAFSLASACLILLAILLMRIYRRDLTQRVSLHLTCGIAVADILFHTASMEKPKVTSPGAYCRFTVWLIVFSNLLFIFLTVCIGINLLMVFIFGMRDPHFLEKCYFAASILLALGISIIPVIFDKFTLDPNINSCWYDKADITAWELMTHNLWIILGEVVCSLSITAVCVKLLKHKNELLKNHPADASGDTIKLRRAKRFLHHGVARIILYPTVPVISQTAFILVGFVPKEDLELALYIAMILNSTQGFMNLAVFLFDPSIQASWKKIRKDLIDQYHFRYNSENYNRTFDRIMNWMVKRFFLTRRGDHYFDSKFYSFDDFGASVPLRSDIGPPNTPPPEVPLRPLDLEQSPRPHGRLLTKEFTRDWIADSEYKCI
ncbi:hypothetical protein K493DRAFT_374209 [Basidiobolus meristosporus CBS 931.73]|uniref:G-protein coupled receptors family 1 profile domain-containing protein n=1 Tax=Basidiobolus meristosporus CBS 931.73 TaxID=1314790 RepID=A0A1Y1Y7X3_9FUNG|nr:hypothetical protein K493DRAFT_374209 [Basidiobolus meristosporus CBS 931.73]|eukprot:ORX94117.1 hypothetical protein K493DRAFT_374209 [Basidiobolus meristosporus CBS 931.73]